MIGFKHQIRVFKYSLLLAIRSMRHRSFRTFLTVIGIMIGITTFTALMSIGIGMRTQIYALLNQFAGASMVVMSKISSSRPTIPESVCGYLEDIDGINYTSGLIEDFVTINGENIMLTATDPEFMEFLLGLQVMDGMSLVQAVSLDIPHACVIDESAQELLNVKMNETIIASSGITGNFMELKVVGIVESLSAGGGIPIGGIGGIAYVDLETMQQMLMTTNVMVIMIGLDTDADTDAVRDAIVSVYPEAQVITEEEILQMMNQIVGIINGVLLALSAISLVVGALMIMNTTMMSVIERTREIGIIKSIGAKRSHVLTIFLTEAFLISLIGGVLGSLLAVGGVLGISQVMGSAYGFELPYSFAPWIFIVGMLLAVIIGLASGFYPAWNASSIKPVEALRYE